MATDNFVYLSDRLGGRAFDYHSRNGGQGICQQKLPAEPNTFFKCPGYARGFARGGMLAAGIDSHINRELHQLRLIGKAEILNNFGLSGF